MGATCRAHWSTRSQGLRRAPAIPLAMALIATGLVTVTASGAGRVAAAAPPGIEIPGVGMVNGNTGATQGLDAVSADGTKIVLWSDADLTGDETTGPDPDV